MTPDESNAESKAADAIRVGAKLAPSRVSKLITRAKAIERLKAGAELERNQFTSMWFIRGETDAFTVRSSTAWDFIKAGLVIHKRHTLSSIYIWNPAKTG